MINPYRKILALILLAIIWSCQPKESVDYQKHDYTVCLGEFSSQEEAELFRSKTDFRLWRELKIEQLETNRFVLLYGSYNSSYEAGEKAFELFNNSIIVNYKIFRTSGYVRDDFANLIFIAPYQGRPSIYSFNIISKKYSAIWSRWGRKVITLNHTHDRSAAYITTALAYGKVSGLPYLKDARVNFYSSNKERIDELNELGGGVQLYTYWENPDTFKINLTFPDSIYSEILHQKLFSFDVNGNMYAIHERSFSLTKDGFPKPPMYQPILVSPQEGFRLRIVKDGNENYMYLRNLKQNSEELITSFNGKLKNSLWSKDDRFLFLITENENSSAGELLIIKTGDQLISRNIKGKVFHNLLLQGNLLFFDRQFEGIPQITVLDINADSIYSQINIPGGCGLFFLPPRKL